MGALSAGFFFALREFKGVSIDHPSPAKKIVQGPTLPVEERAENTEQQIPGHDLVLPSLKLRPRMG